MIAFIAPEFEKSFFGSFLDLKLFVVPLIFVVLAKESSKSFLRGPSYRNPFQLLLGEAWYRLHLDWEFSINIVLNLLNGRVRSIFLTSSPLRRLNTLILGDRNLKPISHFENISLL